MTTFDPYQKEKDLRAESNAWDTSQIEDAKPDDIPIIDLNTYLTNPTNETLQPIANQLRTACEQTGFFTITGHQIPQTFIDQTFEQVKQFHNLPIETKTAIQMDREDYPHGGIGYLPMKNKKLPARDTPNLNEAFILKRDHQIKLQDNQWPTPAAIPEFRTTIEQYAEALESLGKRLLPIFATALEMPNNFFDQAFQDPLYRLRMTHYPPAPQTTTNQPTQNYGIAPHVDTTFITILAQNKPGLIIYSERRKKWIKAPLLKNAFIVNSGELLRQWTNDRFLSVKHFANNNTAPTPRYSIPFFFNANPNHVMACIPSCCSEYNPAKYPPVSYAESQAIAQGE